MDFHNSSGIRSPFSPRVRQSIAGAGRRSMNLSSLKKTQGKFPFGVGEHTGEVIYKTPQITIETFGTPLPVTVTEALTFGSGGVSVRMSACGWCWAVCGRRVLAWPLCAPAPSAPPSAAPAPARELTLPQTDLAHKADLVVIFYEGNAQMPSCVGVSPEGTVRYWPSVAQEAVFVEQCCELQGQECDRLSDSGLVLATTTCSVVMVTTAQEDAEGRPSVSCRTLRPPSGWLGGLGRRVSLLFFGAMPTQPVDVRLVGAVVLEAGGEAGGAAATVALVARGPVLQLWHGADLHEHDLRRPLALSHPELGNTDMECVDVVGAGPRGLVLLMAGAMQAARDHHMRYAIVHVSLAEAMAEDGAPRVQALALGVYPLPPAPTPPAAPRLLPLGTQALLYTDRYIALIHGTIPNDKVEVVELGGEHDRVLGGAVCGSGALLFGAKHGVMLLSCLSQDRSICESPMGSPCPSDMYDGNLTLYEIDPHEVLSVTRDPCGKLKTAFLFHVRREHAACRRLLEEAFPAAPDAGGGGGGGGDVDAALDVAALRAGTELLDDVPGGDPRWRPAAPAATAACVPLGSSAALHISAQLADKQRALSLYLHFLREQGVWQRLGSVSAEGGGARRTAPALAALPELVAAALALRALQQTALAAHIDAAVYHVAHAGEEEPAVEAALAAGTLSASDVCYRRVTRTPRVLAALAAAAARDPDLAPADDLHHVLRAITTVLSEVHACRAQWSRALRVRPERPWTAERGAGSLLAALLHAHRQIFISVNKCSDATVRGQTLEQAAILAEQLLTEARQLGGDHYRQLRNQLLRPYLEARQSERAAVLAEKFRDLDLLIEMCVRERDYDRLCAYIDKYKDEGLLQASFAWLSDRGGEHWVALVTKLGVRYPDALTAWLQGVESRLPLLALHALQQRSPALAGGALCGVARSERGLLARMSAAASMSRLCALAACEGGSSPADHEATRLLTLVEQHAAVPRELRRHHGMEADREPVLTPEEILHMYVTPGDVELTEYDYKMALDLTELIDDMERRDDLRLRVWCAAIKQDTWSPRGSEREAADDLHDKIFFRLINLVNVMGGDLELLLPPLEDVLTAPELADLLSDTFHYTIKYGYESLRAHAH